MISTGIVISAGIALLSATHRLDRSRRRPMGPSLERHRQAHSADRCIPQALPGHQWR